MKCEQNIEIKNNWQLENNRKKHDNGQRNKFEALVEAKENKKTKIGQKDFRIIKSGKKSKYVSTIDKIKSWSKKLSSMIEDADEEKVKSEIN